jgi:hypothetical protein
MSRKRQEEQARDKGPTPVSRLMQQRIFDQEEIVMVARPGRLATLPKFVLTLGLYSFWRRRDTSVLTDQRILLGTGIVRRRERSIPLAVIDDVTFARRGINSYADVTFRDGRSSTLRRIGPMTPRTARRFTRETLRRL